MLKNEDVNKTMNKGNAVSNIRTTDEGRRNAFRSGWRR